MTKWEIELFEILILFTILQKKLNRKTNGLIVHFEFSK